MYIQQPHHGSTNYRSICSQYVLRCKIAGTTQHQHRLQTLSPDGVTTRARCLPLKNITKISHRQLSLLHGSVSIPFSCFELARVKPIKPLYDQYQSGLLAPPTSYWDQEFKTNAKPSHMIINIYLTVTTIQQVITIERLRERTE